jgi:hypothetical protein
MVVRLATACFRVACTQSAARSLVLIAMLMQHARPVNSRHQLPASTFQACKRQLVQGDQPHLRTCSRRTAAEWECQKRSLGKAQWKYRWPCSNYNTCNALSGVIEQNMRMSAEQSAKNDSSSCAGGPFMHFLWRLYHEALQMQLPRTRNVAWHQRGPRQACRAHANATHVSLCGYFGGV